MRHHLLIALALLPLVNAGCGGSGEHEGGDQHVHGQDDSGFVFLDPQHPSHPNWVDFGDLELGETRVAVVKLRNVEKVPIVVENLQSGCSCTIPEVFYVDAAGTRVTGNARSNQRVIEVPPQAVLEVHLKVDSKLSPAVNKDKLVIVRMTTDSDVDPYVSIEARMKVVSAFQAAPAEIDVRRIGTNAGGVAGTEIAPIGHSGRRLVDVLEAPAGVTATLSPSSRQGIDTWDLYVKVEAPVPPGSREQVVRLRTTGPGGEGEGAPFDIKVRWTATDDVEVVPNRLVFLRDSGTGIESAQSELFARMPGQKLRITGHRIQGENTQFTTISYEAQTPDDQGRSARWLIRVDPTAELGDRAIQGLLVLETDDSQFPTIEVPLVRRGGSS